MPQRCDLATQEARHEERQEGGKQGEWRTRACGRRKRYASASAQGASQYASKRRESPGGLSALEEPLEGDQKVFDVRLTIVCVMNGSRLHELKAGFGYPPGRSTKHMRDCTAGIEARTRAGRGRCRFAIF